MISIFFRNPIDHSMYEIYLERTGVSCVESHAESVGISAFELVDRTHQEHGILVDSEIPVDLDLPFRNHVHVELRGSHVIGSYLFPVNVFIGVRHAYGKQHGEE